MPRKPYSYEEYLGLLTHSSDLKMHETSSQIIERFKAPLKIPSRHVPALYLLDYTKRKYLYVSNGVHTLFNLDPSYFYEVGLDGVINSWHPADLKIINNRVFPHNLDFLKNIPMEKYGDIIFTHNYRMLNAKKEYLKILQRYSYIPSNVQGMPFGVIGIVLDITHFKNEHSIVHTIEESELCNGKWVNRLLYKKTHPVFDDEESLFFTKRETEILQLMSKGLSSKQIANKMDISINTVNNHRKNMLCKTKCSSSSELMNMAVRHGWL